MWLFSGKSKKPFLTCDLVGLKRGGEHVRGRDRRGKVEGDRSSLLTHACPISMWLKLVLVRWGPFSSSSIFLFFFYNSYSKHKFLVIK
jgi:hypothetical protein